MLNRAKDLVAKREATLKKGLKKFLHIQLKPFFTLACLKNKKFVSILNLIQNSNLKK